MLRTTFTRSPRLAARLSYLALTTSALFLLTTEAARGQASSLTPDSLGAEFQAAIRGMGWLATARRMHPDALRRFRYLIDVFVETDESGATREFFFDGLAEERYRSMSDDDVFVRVLGVMMEQLPGLLHALVVRDVEIIGSVHETPDLGYVVYRSQARLDGAQPEIRVMSLKRAPDGWRVLASQELDVILESLRGTPRRLRRSQEPP